MALTKTTRTLVASTANAAGATTRGTINLNAVQGPSRLTLSIANGLVGPATQCTARVPIAHNATLPAPASAGANWKTLFPPVGPGVGANAANVGPTLLDGKSWAWRWNLPAIPVSL